MRLAVSLLTTGVDSNSIAWGVIDIVYFIAFERYIFLLFFRIISFRISCLALCERFRQLYLGVNIHLLTSLAWLMITFGYIRVLLLELSTGHENQRSFKIWIAYGVVDFVLFVPLLNRLDVWLLTLSFALALVEWNTFSRNSVHILQVATQVSALSKSFPAFWTGERSLSCVFSKVITQVATLFKDWATATMSTLKVKLYTHRLRVTDLYGLVPAAWDTLECFGLRAEGNDVGR